MHFQTSKQEEEGWISDDDDEEGPQIDVLQPPIIWICGGPGSNKVDKMEKVLGKIPEGWQIISTGKILWSILEADEELGKGMFINHVDIDSSYFRNFQKFQDIPEILENSRDSRKTFRDARKFLKF